MNRSNAVSLIESIAGADEVGQEGIAYWESVKRDYGQLSKEAAISKLIKAERIDQKINVIAKSIEKASHILDE